MLWRFLLASLAAVTATGSGCTADDAGEEAENVGEVSQAEVVSFSEANCPYSSMQVGAVNPDKTLIIRDPSVVDDECRTQWTKPAGCDNNSVGRWTFWQLMENMRGGTPTTAEFILTFLEQFRDTTPVNTFPMQDRSKIQSLIIDPWRVASGCAPGSWASQPCTELRNDLAPFRLLAIVNRVDLHAHHDDPAPTYGGGAGEGRFIFGFLDARGYLDENSTYTSKMPNDLLPLRGTVILEYALPTDDIGADPQFWASQWWGLSYMSFGASSADFNTTFNYQLQFLTDWFTGESLSPHKPNRSALNQIRTNEIDFDPWDPSDTNIQEAPAWELREHKLTCTPDTFCDDARLKAAPVTLTPANSFGFDLNVNDSLSLPPSTLSDFLQDATFGPSIEEESHDVPVTYNGQPFRGGSSRQGEFFAESHTWVNTANLKASNWTTTFFPGDTTVRTRRRLFGLGTCNGCHYNETKTQQLHVSTREVGSASSLSPFLAVSATSASGYLVTDPVTKGSVAYNEPRRRICELLWVANGNLTRLTTNAGRPH